ncbi:hypothetical protein Agub_g9431, partial [Astrephomene gubernaculifera]
MQGSWGSGMAGSLNIQGLLGNVALSNILAALHQDNSTDLNGMVGTYMAVNPGRLPSDYGKLNVLSADGGMSVPRTDDTPSRHLWVGKVMTNVDRALLEELFAHFGPVESVRVFPGKAFAFVNFVSAQHAATAKATLHGQLVHMVTCNRPLEIRYQKRQIYHHVLQPQPTVVANDLQGQPLHSRDQYGRSSGVGLGEGTVDGAKVLLQSACASIVWPGGGVGGGVGEVKGDLMSSSSSCEAAGVNENEESGCKGTQALQQDAAAAMPPPEGQAKAIASSGNGPQSLTQCEAEEQRSTLPLPPLPPTSQDVSARKGPNFPDDGHHDTATRHGIDPSAPEAKPAHGSTDLEALLSSLNALGLPVDFGDKGNDKSGSSSGNTPSDPDGAVCSNGTTGADACSSSTAASSVVDSTSTSACDDCDSGTTVASDEGTAGCPSRHLWLGNVIPGLDKNVLEALFRHFGPVESIRVFPDKNFAFVNFVSPKDAAAAKAALHGQQVPPVSNNNRPLEVRYQLRPQGQQQQNSALPQLSFLNSIGLGVVRAASMIPYLTPRDYAGLHLGLVDGCSADRLAAGTAATAGSAVRGVADTGAGTEVNGGVVASGSNIAAGVEGAPAGSGRSEQPGRCLWLGNIPSNVDRAVLEEVFTQFGPLESVRIFPDRNFAFVNFQVPEHAAAAKENLNGRPVHRLTGSNPLLVRYPRNTSRSASSGERADAPAAASAMALAEWLLGTASAGLNLAPAANLCNMLNPNSGHFNPEFAERYKQLSKPDKDNIQGDFAGAPGPHATTCTSAAAQAGAGIPATGFALPVGGGNFALAPQLAQVAGQGAPTQAQVNLKHTADFMVAASAAGAVAGQSGGIAVPALVQGADNAFGSLMLALQQQQHVLAPAGAPVLLPQGVVQSMLPHHIAAINAGLVPQLVPQQQQMLLPQHPMAVPVGAPPPSQQQMLYHLRSVGSLEEALRLYHSAPAGMQTYLGTSPAGMDSSRGLPNRVLQSMLAHSASSGSTFALGTDSSLSQAAAAAALGLSQASGGSGSSGSALTHAQLQ